jgi:hypothetical protein
MNKNKLDLSIMNVQYEEDEDYPVWIGIVVSDQGTKLNIMPAVGTQESVLEEIPKQFEGPCIVLTLTRLSSILSYLNTMAQIEKTIEGK